ncbi:MAG: hypothetical protein M1834_009085 [Cirrosporium novae-zelandiae]|nr:MAG: hypothetical protein M1834_009085 [Cirrosporium novae-zelandiae]
MEILGGVFTVIQIAEDIGGQLGRYIMAVKDARGDINRLHYEVLAIHDILKGVENLENDPDVANLTALELLLRPEGLIKKCQQELEDLHSKLNPKQGNNSMRRVGSWTLKWPFSSKEIDKRITTLERWKGSINTALIQANLSLEKTADIILKPRQQSTIIGTDVSIIREEVKALQNDTSNRQIAETHTEIVKWLSVTDPSPNHHAACKKHELGTGKWFVCGTDFEEWMAKQNSFLWLHGTPGSGKTILTSTIVESVKEFCSSKPAVAFAYFYFDFSDSEKQNAVNFVSSLVSQLCSQAFEMPELLEQLYERCNGSRRPDIVDLKEVLNEFATLTSLDDIYIVVDALDECPKGESREELLELIEDLNAWSPSKIHLLVTSRPELDIKSKLISLSRCKIISIQGSQTVSDIKLYIDNRLAHEQKLKRLPNDIKVEVKEVLTAGANGMFRWVFCQLDALKKCSSPKAVRQALGSLPRTLDESYARILVDIDDEDRDKAHRALLWLAYSERPLGINELAEAAIIDPNAETPFDPDDRFFEDFILEVLGSLVVLISQEPAEPSESSEPTESTIIFLAHFSVKEYLTSDRIRQDYRVKEFGTTNIAANSFITSSCLHYILFYSQSDIKTTPIKDFKLFPLLEYACKYWYIHRRLLPESDQEEVDNITFRLFSSDVALQSWVQIDFPNKLDYYFESQAKRPAKPLYYASATNLQGIVQRLINNGADVNRPGGLYGTPLQTAVHVKNETIIQLLLDNGADINAPNTLFGTALQAAAYTQNKAIVQLLLDNGADVNAQGENFGTALQAAIFPGNEPIVKLLLNNKADVNAQGGYFGNALRAAKIKGCEEMVQLLIEHGAVDPIDFDEWEPDALHILFPTD